jgi:hypothetical protein
MTGSVLLLIAVLVSAQGQPSRSPGSAERPKPAPITVEAGLAAIETLRSDGLRALNHLVTAGRTTTADRIETARIEGPLKYQEHVYRQYYDDFARSFGPLSEAIKKVVPTEPIAADARAQFGEASSPDSAVRVRKQAWIRGRLKAVDEAWLATEGQVLALARGLSSRKSPGLAETEHGRGWQRGRGGKPCQRELDAAGLRARLDAELERRLSEYWDEAREAWLAAGSGK